MKTVNIGQVSSLCFHTVPFVYSFSSNSKHLATLLGYTLHTVCNILNYLSNLVVTHECLHHGGLNKFTWARYENETKPLFNVQII